MIGLLGEEDFLLGGLLMFIGIAAGRIRPLGILAGAAGNVGLGIFLLSPWEYGKYFFIGSQFLLGLQLGKIFFRPGFFFAMGQVFGCLVTLLSACGQELWGEFTMETAVLILLSVLQSILYYYSTRSPKTNSKHSLVQYYSSYPPQRLSALLLYISYSLFFVSYSSILVSFIKLGPNTYLPILYLSTNLTLSLSYLSIHFLFLTGFYKFTKERLLGALLGLSLIFLVPNDSEPVFWFSFLFVHYSWNTINDFDLYVYGKHKTGRHFYVLTSALGGSIYSTCYMLFPVYLSILNYLCCVSTLAVSLVLFIYFKELHPHPSFLPLMYQVDHFILYQDCPYTIRKRIQEELLNKLI